MPAFISRLMQRVDVQAIEVEHQHFVLAKHLLHFMFYNHYLHHAGITAQPLDHYPHPCGTTAQPLEPIKVPFCMKDTRVEDIYYKAIPPLNFEVLVKPAREPGVYTFLLISQSTKASSKTIKITDEDIDYILGETISSIAKKIEIITEINRIIWAFLWGFKYASNIDKKPNDLAVRPTQ